MAQSPLPQMASLRTLMDQFPALGKLGKKLGAPELPVIQQTMATDCGAASLAMVLGLLGRETELSEVRDSLAVGRDGVTARSILEAAAVFHLRGRGVRVELSDMGELPMGAILHWNFTHFVVFEKVSKEGVHLVDPAFGRRVASMEEARRAFTGVALLFEKDELFAPSKSKKKPLTRHLTAALKGSDDWGRLAVLSVLLQLCSLVLPLINGRLIDRVIPRNDTHLLLVLVIGFAVTLAFYFLGSLVRGQLLLHLRTRFDAKMTMGFVEHMLRLPYDFFERRQVADLQLRVGSVTTIRELLTGAVLSGFIDGTLVVFHLAFLAIMSLKMTAFAVVLVGLQGGAYLLTRKRLRELSAGSLAKNAEAAGSLNELLSGMESLKASGAEHQASQNWATHYVDVMNIGLRRGNVANWSEALLGTLNIVGPMFLLIGGILEVMSHEMTLGTMLSANALAVGFMRPTMNLVGTLQQIQLVRVHLARIDDVLNTTPEQEAGGGRRVTPRLRGEISVENVSFRYNPKLPEVVRNVSVKIAPGECIAIVGRSGSGKTTLGRVLLGLYQPTEGMVRFDNMPLSSLELRSMRKQLGVVVQKPHIFGTTIRANIALGDPGAPLERLTEAGRRACIHADIMKMPMQYDTPVVAGGSSLSGGQRQRIALARALVHDPAILLLDEATSALDAMTEAKVQEELQALSCTRIFIAHRLSTVVNADRILVMDEGVLVEQGNHAELLAKNGIYARLVAAQLGGSRPHGARAAEAAPALPAAPPVTVTAPPVAAVVEAPVPMNRPLPAARIDAPAAPSAPQMRRPRPAVRKPQPAPSPAQAPVAPRVLARPAPEAPPATPLAARQSVQPARTPARPAESGFFPEKPKAARPVLVAVSMDETRQQIPVIPNRAALRLAAPPALEAAAGAVTVQYAHEYRDDYEVDCPTVNAAIRRNP